MSNDSLIEVLRRRTYAGWIDVIVLAVVYTALSALTGNAHIGSWTSYGANGATVHQAGFSVDLPTGPFLVWVGIALLYYSGYELLSGQTLGKRVMGLKVVMVNGRQLSARAVTLRTLGRLIDGLPVFYLVGWIAMRGPHRPPQRLGDRVAGTTVVPVSDP